MSLSPAEINLIIKAGQDPFDPKFQTEMPVEYVLGKAEFYGHLFNVNANVLIPRIETEQIIRLGLEYIIDRKSISFADVATGSGVIGIVFAEQLNKRGVTFDGYLSDISDAAIEVAKQNLDEHLDPKHLNCFTNGINDSKLKVIRSDLLSDYPKNKKFDLIFSNLPYIPSARITQLARSVKDFEPHLALDGGVDGLDLIKKLIEQSREYLAKDGVLILEVDDTHTQEKISELGIDANAVEDEFGKNRFWIVKF